MAALRTVTERHAQGQILQQLQWQRVVRNRRDLKRHQTQVSVGELRGNLLERIHAVLEMDDGLQVEGADQLLELFAEVTLANDLHCYAVQMMHSRQGPHRVMQPIPFQNAAVKG